MHTAEAASGRVIRDTDREMRLQGEGIGFPWE